MNQVQFLSKQNQREHTPRETMVIGTGDRYWESVEMEGEKYEWFACLNNLVTYAEVGNQSFGSRKLGI